MRLTLMPHKLGWLPDIPDQRDHTYSAPAHLAVPLPQSIDLRPGCPPVYDQGELGSCTANAIAAAIEFDRLKQGLSPFIPSRLFIYYNEREMEGTIESDSGAMIRDGIKSVNKLGACNETEWPYDICQFRQRPDEQCYQDARLDRAVSYQRVTRDLTQMKACLASGLPFVFGFSVYASFESQDVAGRGIVPMPKRGEQMLGGHAVVAVGYHDYGQRFICRNSWGTGWGVNGTGYFEMPYKYLLNKGLASDFWVIKTIG
jgi:C1A family cysteine protease